MIRSDDRILTTHVGSLPRNEVLTDLLIRREAGEAVDAGAMGGDGSRRARRLWRHRRRPASTSATTASSSASAFRPIFQRACRASAANPSARSDGFRRSARTDRDVPAALSQAQQNFQRAAGDRRGTLPRHQGH